MGKLEKFNAPYMSSSGDKTITETPISAKIHWSFTIIWNCPNDDIDYLYPLIPTLPKELVHLICLYLRYTQQQLFDEGPRGHTYTNGFRLGPGIRA
jgi:hypothetical protein